ncbi:MAG: FG-GAP repeat domain-containing protein [Planctomycetota bacterium]|jgi:hypothetical protein
MSTRQTLVLGLSASFFLTACGGGGGDASGLILSKSIFASSGEPTPATMVLMRPPAAGSDGQKAEWSEEVIAAEAQNVEFQLGAHEGEVVFRRIDSEEGPVGPVVDLQARGDQWSMVDRTDVEPDAVEWETTKSGKPKTKDYEIAGGNVFHKAMWWQPAFGEPGILTISANMPYLQVWRGELGGWEAETLWTAEVGGKEQRFRDVEVGDVDSDGMDELVVVTHDLGAIFVLEQTAEGIEATEVHKLDERTFVHEVEICDVDGDGKLEFFTTPSEPNKLGAGEHDQGGGIDMFRYDEAQGAYVRTSIAHYDHEHAKEILGYDYDDDGRAEIYAALESDGLRIQVYRWDAAAGGMVAEEDIEIDGPMCRFLNGGDTNGDGVREIVAATNEGGIFALSRDGGEDWVPDRIVPPFASGGFEHATLLFDWDGDGADELFVADDNGQKVQRVYFDRSEGSGRYRRETLISLKGQNYITWNVMELPPGK